MFSRSAEREGSETDSIKRTDLVRGGEEPDVMGTRTECTLGYIWRVGNSGPGSGTRGCRDGKTMCVLSLVDSVGESYLWYSPTIRDVYRPTLPSH